MVSGSTTLDAAPTTNARLSTLLPDKYPGETIAFTAIVFTLRPVVTVSYGDRWPLTLSAAYTRTFSHLRSRQFQRNAFVVGGAVGVSRQ